MFTKLRMIAMVAPVALLAIGSPAQAGITVNSWALTTYTDNGFNSGPAAFVTESAVSLPFALTRNVTQAPAPDTTSQTVYNFTVAGDDVTFDFDFNQTRNGKSGSDSESFGNLTFVVGSCDMAYNISGNYSISNSTSNATRWVQLNAEIKDNTTNTVIFRSKEFSQQTANESFTLGGPVNEGDQPASFIGNLTGTLIAGHSYTFSYSVFTFADINTTDAVGTGGMTLAITGASNPPVIGTPPASATACLGDSVTFSVAASGSPPLTYQWKKGGVDLTGETNSSLTINPVAAGDAGSYTVLVTNPCGSVLSDPAVLTIQNSPPTVTLIGPNSVTVECHTGTYTEQGATATDDCDGALPVTMGGETVNVDVPDTYTLTYSATDSDNNTTTVTRDVVVQDTVGPVITLNGNSPLSVECGSVYSDPGATAFDACDGDRPVTMGGDVVDSDMPGTYSVTYDAEDSSGNDAVQMTRTVIVQDTTGPVITLNGTSPMTVECGDTYTEPNATATDGCEGAVMTVTIGGDVVDTSTPGTYIVTYDAEDSLGNDAVQATRTVTVQDTAPPVITLNGSASVTLECHVDTYTEAGATADDDCEGAAPVTIGGDAVDVNTPGVYVVTYDAVDSAGNPAVQVTRTVTVDDTLPPTLTVNTTPIVVVDCDCSGSENVTLPPASASDACDTSVSVTNDGPASFPAGQTTTVTFTATDDSGNTTTATVDVKVKYGATVKVRASVHHTGYGCYPTVTRQDLIGITVNAYDTSPGGCVDDNTDNCGNISWQEYAAIFANCAPINSGVTDSQGKVEIDLPPGDYILIGYIDTDDDNDPDRFLAAVVRNLCCGDTEKAHLRLIKDAQGRRKPCKCKRFTGSELIVVEPEYMVWDEEEQLYPFVLETEGDWEVTTSVTPPEGFVADYEALSAEVADEIESVQFTITEVGSDLVPTKTEFQIKHNGATQVFKSKVGIILTEEYAQQRGFNVGQLKAKGLIISPQGALEHRRPAQARQPSAPQAPQR